MGYKLAGFDVIGCNEIDHRMMYAYCQNHNPKFPFLEPIQEFKKKSDLPPELFSLDILFDEPRYLSQGEECCVATFPQDYDFAGNKPHYICGMSVPPVMMAQVASRIYEQWLSKINNKH